MKTRTLIIAASISFAVPTFAQTSGVLAHWDFVDGATGSATFAPEDNGIDCVKPHNITKYGLNYSWSTADSEDGSKYGANCFGSWDGGATGDYVAFAVTFSNEAAGGVSKINFDIANYGKYYDPDYYAVRVYKNGTSLGYVDNAWKAITAVATSNSSGQPWSASADQNLDVSSFNLTSAHGSEDTFEFRIYTTGASSSSGRIALDNFRAVGKVDCVPEPSSAALMGLASLALLVRRKR
ncbi:MAG: PEP-CTERM sorting domain-containing protein [Akkermansiaceae bacterium]|nr:PEP-CTERM sorting domain-containing protein [Akkermansiaceae bacterium]